MSRTGIRTGTAELPLHSGAAPRWLFARMVRLARGVLSHVVADYGPEEVLRRLGDPFWFQDGVPYPVDRDTRERRRAFRRLAGLDASVVRTGHGSRPRAGADRVEGA